VNIARMLDSYVAHALLHVFYKMDGNAEMAKEHEESANRWREQIIDASSAHTGAPDADVSARACCGCPGHRRHDD
jgi:hypothetical protein